MKLTVDDLDSIAIGATLLGSGGGGDVECELLRAKEYFSKTNGVELVTLQSVSDEALILPMAFMGAPMVSIEKLASGTEGTTLLHMCEKHFGKKVDFLCPCEIGGSNAFVPLIVACQTNRPVLDADMIGRAFPELQMSACNIHGISCSPCFVADSLGNSVTFFTEDPKRLEEYCRKLTECMGLSACVSLYILSGKDAKKALVANTISQAHAIGNLFVQAGGDIASVQTNLSKHYGAKHIASGIISDIHQSINDGFLRGTVTINKDITLYFQNEYLHVTQGSFVLATTPDIIAILEEESCMPLSVEKLGFGQKVSVLSLEAPKIWKTKKGMVLVGPQVFGYEENK